VLLSLLVISVLKSNVERMRRRSRRW